MNDAEEARARDLDAALEFVRRTSDPIQKFAFEYGRAYAGSVDMDHWPGGIVFGEGQKDIFAAAIMAAAAAGFLGCFEAMIENEPEIPESEKPELN